MSKYNNIKVYTNIDDPKLTKLTKYMFFVELGSFYPSSIEKAFEDLQPRLWEEFDQINAYIDDENTKDYNIKQELTEVVKKYTYHVLVRTDNPRFRSSLHAIKENPYYIDCYQYKDCESNLAVIRIRSCMPKRFRLLFSSDYSKLWESSNYSILRSKYSTNKIRYKVIDHSDYTKDNSEEESDAYGVLTHSESYFYTMLERYNIPEKSDLADQIKNKEYDSKYNIENETLTWT